MKHETKREPAADHARPSSFVSLLSGWVQQGMESFFATQRILVDVAMRQNANLMKTMRDTMADPKHSPVSILTELAVEGTANFIEAQRILLDLAQRENEIVFDGVKERVGGSITAVAMTDLVRRSIDTFVEMQHEFLTIANRQAQNWMEDAKAGKPYDRERIAEIAREGMETFVGAQKKFLDVIAEQTELATSGKEHGTKASKRKELTVIARESATAVIDAQKKLLDVASQQMNVNLQLATRASEMATPFRLPIAKLTGDGVKSFVDAEKALIDSMIKRGHERSGGTKRPAKTASRRRKPMRPRAAAATA